MITQDLTIEQQAKVKGDLDLISLISKVGKELNCRVIIAGGYAVDAALGQITRPHNDIDIQIYGQDENGMSLVNKLLNAIAEQDAQFAGFSIEDKVRKDFYHNLYTKIGGTIADIYYLRTQNSPFESNKIIIKKDGSLSEPHPYETKQFRLNGIEFEGQNPLTELVDKIYKRDYRNDPKLVRHEQDIENLKAIVPAEELDQKLQELKNRP